MTATFDQARHLLKVLSEKHISQEKLAALHDSGLLTDLLEVAGQDKLGVVDRTVYRHVLGLPTQAGEDTPHGEQRHLRHLGNLMVAGREESFDPAAYFQDRENLVVWSEFRDRILAAAGSIKSAPTATLAIYELVKASNDKEISDELSAHHIFEDASVFCSYLATLLDRQPRGEDGDLLSNGHVNIFYVRGINSEVFAVYAYLSGDLRRWSVSAGRLDVNRWYDDHRVLSSNC